MNWTRLESEEDLSTLNEISRTKLCLLFKFSTRCPTSSVALDRLERDWKSEEMQAVQPYFLDLIKFRNLSDKVADFYDVRHESPQVLLIEKGNSIFESSHFWIKYDQIRDAILKRTVKSEI